MNRGRLPTPSLRLYYHLKPYLRPEWRMWVRRHRARHIQRVCKDIWPIHEASGAAPEGWPGWPKNKDFAFVLTHDVESAAGIENVRKLAELEMEFGLRSSFNFIPEGSYEVPSDLRQWLLDNGFEVGVHDLNHDGHLFSSRKGFQEKATRINRYLDDWGAVGFRSGFMLRQLDWQRDLDIVYDASTFDTDPFEPLPDGSRTVFPYFVPDAPDGRKGYVELPYTLAQDSTLFLQLGEHSPRIWQQKLDWLVEKKGMALVNIHPDYIRFGNEGETMDGMGFSEDLVRSFFEYLTSTYKDGFWNPAAKDLAIWYRDEALPQLSRREIPVQSEPPMPEDEKKKIWIDLENTPHIPFFKPIIRELRAKHYGVVITARDAYQTCELATEQGLPYEQIGRHYGQNKLLKVMGLGIRAAQLLPFVLRERPDLAVNHGSRTQNLISNLLGIPTVTLMDYEHSGTLPLLNPAWEIVPDVVSEEGLHCTRPDHIRKYPGIKEDVYVPEFTLDTSLRSQLGLEASVIVTVRPPATEAHYHNPEGEVLFQRFMERAFEAPDVQVVLLPRSSNQERQLTSAFPHWFEENKIVIPEKVVDGLNLLWHSDLVVSGGGTMNREAAAMGLPVYSIFRGTIGAVDRWLAEQGRLQLITTPEEIDQIPLCARPKIELPKEQSSPALKEIIALLDEIAQRPKS